jgi:outer membrane protein assembly factor BamB
MKPSLALFALTFASAVLADWPQWRGPGRDGHAVDSRLPAVWGAKPPRPVWKQTVGEGQSSPVVAAGRLFVLGRTRDEEGCFCVNAHNGKMLWQTTYPCTFTPTDVTSGFGPKSTPTVDGDRVYMLGAGGVFHAFAVSSGKVLWKHDLKAEFWGAAKDQWGDDAYSTCCGAASSPLVFRLPKGKSEKQGKTAVLLPVGGKKAGALTAFDRETGKVLWKSPLPDRSSYASPMIATLAGARQVVGFTGLRLVGLKPEDGSLLWEYPFEARYEQTIITPVIWKDHVLLAGERKPTVLLRVEKKGERFTAKPAWSNPDLRCYLSTPVRLKDHLFGLNPRHQVVCVDLATGKTAWKGGNCSPYATLVVAGEALLVLSRDGELHVLEANPKRFVRKARWKLPVQEPVWSHLAVAGSRLYVKDHTDVYCFDLARR